MQNNIKYKPFFGNKNIQLCNNNYNTICPQCKLCSNKVWKPKILFSFDTGIHLIYECDCQKTAIIFKEERK